MPVRYCFFYEVDQNCKKKKKVTHEYGKTSKKLSLGSCGAGQRHSYIPFFCGSQQ